MSNLSQIAIEAQQRWSGSDSLNSDGPPLYGTAVPEAPVQDIFDFLSVEEPDFDWLIPGVLERRDRMILTGREGAGKSYFCHQIAVQCAAGIHPFELVDMPPIRVLLIDLENDPRELRRRFRPLTLTAKNKLVWGQLFVRALTGGLDVPSSREDCEWLEGAIRTSEPALLILGPSYKLADGDPNDEKEAKKVAVYLDSLRERFGVALILEAHIPHDAKGRPFGWSGWRRWPEIGVELTEAGLLQPWRPARHETPSLPKALKRGGEWPFTPASRNRDVLWARIVSISTERGYRPSVRDLESALGSSKSTIQDAISEHKNEWEKLEND